jgi:hypothetical protein
MEERRGKWSMEGEQPQPGQQGSWSLYRRAATDGVSVRTWISMLHHAEHTIVLLSEVEAATGLIRLPIYVCTCCKGGDDQNARLPRRLQRHRSSDPKVPTISGVNTVPIADKTLVSRSHY